MWSYTNRRFAPKQNLERIKEAGIDKLPTIYFRDSTTSRYNNVAGWLGFQDLSQLNRDYGDKESTLIQNTMGNLFFAQVVGENEKTLSERFGKALQHSQSLSINRNDTSRSINTQMNLFVPPYKIANLYQEVFLGTVSENFGEGIDQKIFHPQIIVYNERLATETKAYDKIPVIREFLDDNVNYPHTTHTTQLILKSNHISSKLSNVISNASKSSRNSMTC